jgi:hypothetical protein
MGRLPAHALYEDGIHAVLGTYDVEDYEEDHQEDEW